MNSQKTHSASYLRFWVMVTVSTVIGFGAMYLNTYELDHVFFSWTRFFMSMIMGGVMTAVMMLFMWHMYPNKQANMGVIAIAAVLFFCWARLGTQPGNGRRCRLYACNDPLPFHRDPHQRSCQHQG